MSPTGRGGEKCGTSTLRGNGGGWRLGEVYDWHPRDRMDYFMVLERCTNITYYKGRTYYTITPDRYVPDPIYRLQGVTR